MGSLFDLMGSLFEVDSPPEPEPDEPPVSPVLDFASDDGVPDDSLLIAFFRDSEG
ncbi:MAG TPA: hypothetical protein VLA89_07795 [Gemmatimonadales bacterium]|nr:hypothetical protein [Gemmatimonadales bacterium]